MLVEPPVEHSGMKSWNNLQLQHQMKIAGMKICMVKFHEISNAQSTSAREYFAFLLSGVMFGLSMVPTMVAARGPSRARAAGEVCDL